jgi:hypothetical protein
MAEIHPGAQKIIHHRLSRYKSAHTVPFTNRIGATEDALPDGKKPPTRPHGDEIPLSGNGSLTPRGVKPWILV